MTAAPAGASVHIYYRRPPDRVDRYVQQRIYDDNRVKVTFASNLVLDRPLEIDGKVVLESGSDVVWFTFPGAWHDIGRFHRADGSFTGIYANLITPCIFEPGGIWHTTDLFLDLWIPPGGRSRILDEDELDDAENRGWVNERWAARARIEADRLSRDADAGRWPPAVVEAWTRDRILLERDPSPS